MTKLTWWGWETLEDCVEWIERSKPSLSGLMWQRGYKVCRKPRRLGVGWVGEDGKGKCCVGVLREKRNNWPAGEAEGAAPPPCFLTVLETSERCAYFRFQPGDLRFDGNMKWVCIHHLLRSRYIRADSENIFFKTHPTLWEKVLFNVLANVWSKEPHLGWCTKLYTVCSLPRRCSCKAPQITSFSVYLSEGIGWGSESWL